MKSALYDLNLLFLAYFVFVNGFYLVLITLSARVVRRYGRISAMTEYEGVFGTTFYKPVSVIVPAHNEEATIVQTVSSALAVHYPELEVRGRQRRLHRRDAERVDRLVRPGPLSCDGQVRHPLRRHPRPLRISQLPGPARDRQGAGRQGRCFERRHQRQLVPSGLQHRRRFHHRRALHGPDNPPLPRRPPGGRRRRSGHARERLRHREGRGEARGAGPEQPGQVPDGGVPQGLPLRPHRLVAAEQPDDRLRRVRHLPADRADRGTGLSVRRRGGGHGAGAAHAPGLRPEEEALSHRVPSRPHLLDAGPGRHEEPQQADGAGGIEGWPTAW